MRRDLGEVWRVDYTSNKPWAVQGPGAVSRFDQKKKAKAIGELFLKQRDQTIEHDKILKDLTNEHPL